MSTQVETLTYTGTLTELGGKEMGATGNEKPRKVVVKDDPTKQYGKTFRTWHDSLEWNDLEQYGLGALVTIEYVTEQRQGGPQGSYTVNTIVGVRQDGAGVSASDGEGGDWGEPHGPVGEVGPPVGKPVASTPHRATDWDERGIQMEAAWAIKTAFHWFQPGDQITASMLLDKAMELAMLKRRLAAELAE